MASSGRTIIYSATISRMDHWARETNEDHTSGNRARHDRRCVSRRITRTARHTKGNFCLIPTVLHFLLAVVSWWWNFPKVLYPKGSLSCRSSPILILSEKNTVNICYRIIFHSLNRNYLSIKITKKKKGNCFILTAWIRCHFIIS